MISAFGVVHDISKGERRDAFRDGYRDVQATRAEAPQVTRRAAATETHRFIERHPHSPVSDKAGHAGAIAARYLSRHPARKDRRRLKKLESS